MTAPAGHVATTVLPVGDDTHTVENSDGELATDALLDAERVTLPVRDGIKPTVLDADRDDARDADTDADAGDRERDALCVTLPEREGMKPVVPEADTDDETERERERDAVALPVPDGMKPPVLDADADAERDADRLTDAGTDLLAERDADTDAEAVTLKPRVGDVDGDRVGDTSTHCTYSANTAPPAPQPPDAVSAVLGVMEHEFWPRHVALTTASLLAAPGHDPSANGPDGHAPVGLP